MDWHITSNTVLLLLTTVLATGLAIYAWKRRPATGSTLFTLLMLAMAQWSLAYTLEITSVDLDTKLIWAKVQFLGIALLPVGWLTFVLEYTGREARITRRNIFLLAIVPLATFLLAVTNDAHGWVWRQTALDLSHEVYPALYVEYGFWFWVHTIFSYVCLSVAALMLLANWRHEETTLYRWQSVALLFGLMLPWAGNILFISGTSPRELVAFTYLLSGGALVHFTLRFRLFDLAPVAHREIFRSMSHAILVLDTKNRIADVNPEAERIIGRNAMEIIGESIENTFPELLLDTQEQNETPMELTIGPPDTPSYYEVTSSCLRDGHDSPRGHLLVMHDITHQKEIERRREDLTHTMVHDLRDPLSNSLFALEMLRGDLADFGTFERDELLAVTFGQTMKTLRLVDEILEISRLKNGIEMLISRTAFSVAELIERVISAEVPRALEKRIQILTDVPGETPLVWGDMNLIERVLQNLVDNSMKFSPNGGVIRVTASLDDVADLSNERRLLISVSDEGPGIPHDLQEDIFDKFVTGSAKGSGTGLGLAYCKMAIGALDERIWVESEPGRGSRFTFTLPIAFEPELVAEVA